MTIDYRDLVDAVYSAVPDADDAESVIRPDYTGRGMFGDKCLGLVTEYPGDAQAIILDLVESGTLSAAEAKALSRKARTDGMGRRVVTYYPGVTLENVPEGVE